MYAQRGLSLLFSFPGTLDEEGVPVRHNLRSYCSIAGALFLLGPVKCANESTADLFRSTGDVRACHVRRPSSVGVVSGQRLTSPSHGHVQWWQCDSCELARNSVSRSRCWNCQTPRGGRSPCSSPSRQPSRRKGPGASMTAHNISAPQLSKLDRLIASLDAQVDDSDLKFLLAQSTVERDRVRAELRALKP